LAKGFAKAGTASAMAASKAMLRTNEFDFMRVNFLSNRIESAAPQAVVGQRELTRMWRTSTLAREDTYSSWTNGRKDCVSRPRGCHRGVFLNLAKNKPASGCIRIDESLGRNVSLSHQKILCSLETATANFSLVCFICSTRYLCGLNDA